MKNILKSKQNGFAIIEALIAFLLLGIGAAALVYLQGNLMSGSATSKASAEAMELAKDRTEILRNNIYREQYLSALRDVIQDDAVIGVNAEYIVCYAGIPTIPTNPTTDEVKALLMNPVNLEVTVKWPGAEGDAVDCAVDDAKNEKVTLETMLYFMSPVIASATGSGEGGEGEGFSPLLSPLISGVEKRDDSTDGTLDSGRSGTDEHKVMNVDGDGDISFDTIKVTINTYTNSGTGRSNVEVVVDGDVKLTSFGGIVHRIEGDIIVDPSATSTLSDLTKKGNTLLGLFASPPSYCLFSICAEAADEQTEACQKSNGAEYSSYVCYVPGDCTYGSKDSTATSYDSRCPDPTGTLPFEPPPGLDDLNGGWYGRVGNFNVELPQDMVCTADTNLSNADTRKTPSREFATHRWETCDTSNTSLCPKSPFIAGNEGFNRPAIFQTFIIANADKTVGACLELAKDYEAFDRDLNCDLVGDSPNVVGTLMLPPANIIRWVGENDAIPINDAEAFPDIWQDPYIWLNPVLPTTDLNFVLPTYTDYCGFVPIP